jgi:hypothetical protein
VEAIYQKGEAVSEQPEALRLADALDSLAKYQLELGGDGKEDKAAAAELRRQHADIEQLKAQVFLQMKWKTDAQNENERLLEINAELLEALEDLLQEYDVQMSAYQEMDVQRRARAAIAKAEKVKP